MFFFHIWTLQPSKHSFWWRRLQDVFIFKRRLRDVLPRRLQNIFKMPCKNVFKTSSRCLQDVFKTSSRRLRDIFKTFSRCLKDVFKTSLRCLAKMSSRRFQDVTSSYTILVNMFSRCLQDVFTIVIGHLHIRFCLGHTSKKLLSVYKIYKSDNRFSIFSFSLYYTF